MKQLFTIAFNILLSSIVFAQNLGITIYSVSPASLDAGSNISISYDITNYSQTVNITKTIYFAFYYSDNTVLDTDDILLGSYSLSKLNADGSYGASASAKLPLSASNANRYIIAIVDPSNFITESDETDNTDLFGIYIGPKDTYPPAIPKNLKAYSQNGKVALTWDANTELDLAHYTVYRSTFLREEYYKELGYLEKDATSFVDYTATPGIQYEYNITASDQIGNKSGYSYSASAIPLPNNFPPNIPTALTAASNSNRIALSWGKNKELDLKSYQLFRNTTPDSLHASLLTEIVLDQLFQYDTFYEDDSVQQGVKYYYWIKAKNYSGKVSDFSKQVAIELVPYIFMKAPDSLRMNDSTIRFAWFGKTKQDIGFVVDSKIIQPESQTAIYYVSHPAQVYEPVGFNFENKDGVPIFLDYSKCGFSLNVQLLLQGLISPNPYIRFMAVDINGYRIEIKQGTSLDAPWLGEIGVRPALYTEYYNYTFFFKGYQAEYSNSQLCDIYQNNDVTKTPCGITKFNYEKVKGIEIFILRGNPEIDAVNFLGLLLYKPVLLNYNGVCSLGLDDLEEVPSATILQVYPNPVSQGILTLNKTVDWLKVYNAQGELLLTSSSSNQISTEHLPAGLYLLESNKGNVRFMKR